MNLFHNQGFIASVFKNCVSIQSMKMQIDDDANLVAKTVPNICG